MGMHADCGHGTIMAAGLAQLHMQVMTQVLRTCMAGDVSQ